MPAGLGSSLYLGSNEIMLLISHYRKLLKAFWFIMYVLMARKSDV